MILDRIENWRNYRWPNDRFRLAFEYVERLDPARPDGTDPIDGDNIFNLMQTYQTKPQQGELFESHREYADIQIVVRGVEQILWAPRCELEVVETMANDKELQAMISAPTALVLRPGLFAVFFPPDDAHAPCLVHQQSCTVRKACIKVRM